MLTMAQHSLRSPRLVECSFRNVYIYARFMYLFRTRHVSYDAVITSRAIRMRVRNSRVVVLSVGTIQHNTAAYNARFEPYPGV